MKIINVSTVFVLLFVNMVYSQSPITHDPKLDLPKFTPPSPNAAGLGKYGDIPVGLYTGIPNINIPLHNVTLGNFTLPIGISYHSQGLKVEEKAGNIGLNWSLNAGGVITRTTKGLPDEKGAGYWSAGNTWSNAFIASNFNNSSMFAKGEVDLQPDMFFYNFAGYSGKFVIDGTPNHDVHTIPYQPSLKITHSGVLSSFEVTDDKGIKYIFDVKETTTDESPNVPIFYTSSWYLSKVVTPAGDINLTYINDLNYYAQYSETGHVVEAVGTDASAASDAYRFLPQPFAGYNTIMIDSKVLSTISTPNETITFSSAMDREDSPNALRISMFVIRDFNSQLKKKVIFNQSYFGNINTAYSEDCRLKLDQVVEFGSGVSSKIYSFDYDRPAEVPSLKLLSQDYWGFYNGKTNHTLLPFLDPRIYTETAVSQAVSFGNRDADANYSKIGSLQKITYPTAGSTEFVYEANDYSNISGVPVNEQIKEDKEIQVQATKSATVNIPSATKIFTITEQQTIFFTYQGSYGMSIFDLGPALSLNRVNTDGSRTSIQNINMINSSGTHNINLTVGNYEVIASVDAMNQNVIGKVKYYSNSNTVNNKTAGGLRIKRILTTSPANLTQTIKDFSYKNTTDSTLSSGCLVSANNLINHKQVWGGGYMLLIRSSTSTNYLGATQGSAIGYSVVTEKFGPTNNGKKESYFITAAGFPNTWGNLYLINSQNTLSPPDIVSYKNKYLNDYDMCRGFCTKVLTFNSTNKIVHEINDTYNIGASLNPTSANYFEMATKAGMVNFMCLTGCLECLCLSEHVCADCLYQTQRMYIFDNKIVCPWIYKTQSSETNYDQDGLNPYNITTNFFYENPVHGQLTKKEVTISNSSIVRTTYKYAHDKLNISSLSPTATTALDKMVTKNMIGEPIETEEYVGSVLRARMRTNFKIWDAEQKIIMPELVQSQTQFTGLEDRISYYGYDNSGNPQELSRAGAAKNSFIWGYKKQLLTAEIQNAGLTEIYSQNFEENEIDHEATLVRQSSKIHTGKYAGLITNSTSTEKTSHSSKYLSLLTPLARFFTYSGWVYSDGPSAELFLFMYRAGETGYFSYVDNVQTMQTGKWTYLTRTFLVPADVVSMRLRLDNNAIGNVWFDDLRIRPMESAMTNYTYEPLVGLTSQIDSKGQTIFYEYDDLNRLILVKDQDGNIIKSNSYHYKN